MQSSTTKIEFALRAGQNSTEIFGGDRKWFVGVTTRQELIKKFKELAVTNLPANGGDKKVWQSINSEYSRIADRIERNTPKVKSEKWGMEDID